MKTQAVFQAARIEPVFRGSWVRRRVAASYLCIILARFVAELHSRGYTRAVIHRYAQVVEHFGFWLKRSGVAASKLNELQVERFIDHLPRCHCSEPAPRHRTTCRTALTRLLIFLRKPPPLQGSSRKSARIGPGDRLLNSYEQHLRKVRGLSVSTRQRRRREAQLFLKSYFGQKRPELHRINRKNVSRYVFHRTLKLASRGTRHVITSLRCLLRFLEITGRIRGSLSKALPQRAHKPSPELPKVLERSQWRRFMSSFPRHTPIGQRDYAIALCLAELALRADELASLTLDDLDWRAMTLRLNRTKQRRERLLPLPDRVAKALVAYLKEGRPRSTNRALFVRHRAPLGEPLRGRFIRRIMRRAFLRCGIKTTGTHILRHTWATWAHRRGASLKLIADLLGHRSLDTTARYAHLNLEELRQAALPWPRRKR